MSNIEIKHLTKGFGGTEKVIKNLNLAIEEGEFLVLLGPSGCGKTTLLRLIAGLYYCDEGEISIANQDVTLVPASKRGLAMVFQSYALYPHMTVYKNIAFGLRLAKMPRTEIDKRVQSVAKTLEIKHLLQRRPRALSGGQRQRVAIGRAIARNPVAFLFDEPLSNLDAALRSQMRVELAQLHKRLQTTMVYVTHDQMEAMTLADRIVVMNKGKIEQVGAALELYHRPVSLFVAEFLGSPKMNIFKVRSSNGVNLTLGKNTKISLERKLSKGKPRHLGVRPEHIAIVPPAEADFEGVVEVVERLGNDTYLYVRLKDLGLINMRVNAEENLATGDKLGVKFIAKHLHIFGNNGKSLVDYKHA